MYIHQILLILQKLFEFLQVSVQHSCQHISLLCYFNSNQAGVWPLSHMGKIQGGKVSDTVASVDRFHLTDMFLALVH